MMIYCTKTFRLGKQSRQLSLSFVAFAVILLPAATSVSVAAPYQGKYLNGVGDAAALQRIDQSFQFFHANPDVPNLTMLYQPGSNTFEEGAGWGAWWIQNSYGFALASTPFLQPCYRATLQNSLDLFWNNQGDGVRKGKWGTPGSTLYELVAPDGALGDCATQNTIVYKQGDGNVAIHDWMHEATAAGVVMQSEMLLTTRNQAAIAKYLPKMERACNSIETARDAATNLFLVGPAANLLAPSFGGIKQADGTFGKGYLTGLSITYLAAVDRMVELYKLSGDTAKQAEYQHRADITRASLSQLTVSGTQGNYFAKSVEKAGAGLGTKHGVLGQSQFGYLEGVSNVDAVALRVADDATARSIYNTIATTSGIRPNDFLLTNSAPLDDTYWNYGGTEVGNGFEKYGDWVNGGSWGTVEGRAILAYARLGKFDDITKSAARAMAWAKDFRMDAPFSQSGANTSNPWSDTGSHQAGGTSVMIDNFAIPAATIRGLFDYDYRSDRLILRPRIPGEITEYVQDEAVYFGDKKLFLTCQNGGPNVKSVKVNGVSVAVGSSAQAELLYASLPAEAHVEIVTDGGWAASTLPASTPGSFTTAAPAPLSAALRRPYGVLKTVSRLLAKQPGADYERSFVGETIGAINAWQVSCSTDRGPGVNRAMTAEKVATINGLYQSAALNMYGGLAAQMAQSSLSPLWNKVLARTATSEVLAVSATGGPAHMTASGTDLANRGQATLAGIRGSASKFGGMVDAVNDGQMNDSGDDLGSTANSYVPGEGDQLIVTLNVSANKHGYDISQIVSYSAYSVDRIAQNYDIDVLQVGSTEWLPVFSGYDMGRDVQAAFGQDVLGRELKNTVQDSTGGLLADHVWQVRFTFHDTNGFGLGGGAETVYREFDVFGAASVPEPSCAALAVVGLTSSCAFRVLKHLRRPRR
jgi:hypothetical protein